MGRFVMTQFEGLQLIDTSTRAILKKHMDNTTRHNIVSVSATGTATDEISYITINGVEKKIAIGDTTINTVTSISSSSTDNEYPTAKAVYDAINSIATYDGTIQGPTES